MTATEELRRMLDERGVEWENGKSYGAKAVTRFKVNGVWLRYVDYGVYQWLDYHEDEPLTAEQAIAATLGRGTCKPILNSEYKHAPYINDWIVCSACGTKLAERYGKVWQRFCPNCGRVVVTE